ncbi:uncharacterized protein FTJAE_5746 [Fusarium tjaetaba]|uniref:Uncharacterized protein n=1 Tax=Fusarium tjaetaba TaxID=1567544 RepID=A0A8H5RM53_9HYPO|nr:uncharacterized protein FTJAE_5746 [Fusarium tjaetaba]KAF5637331.1 hypothetical protein FTJAE_5746 [Fusarium tjaetaba]
MADHLIGIPHGESCLAPLGFSDEQKPCQPDGEFRLNVIIGAAAFNLLAPSGFFQITLGWGRFSFGTAKLVDVVWDLVVGRGGQTVMAFVSWRVFVQYLQLSLVTKPASYSTVWLIKIQQDNSALATWKLVSGFFKVGLASKKVMCFMIWTALFILGFPTFASSMTGYTPYNKAYVNSTSGKLVQFSEVSRVAYLIKDGDRVNGLSKGYPVLWRGNLTAVDKFNDRCDVMDINDTGVECQLQRDVAEYVQLYGFDGKGDGKNRNKQDKTYFRNQTLNWPPLNIKAFSLPTPFYWNWTLYGTDKFSKEDLISHSNYSKSAFIVEDEIYNFKDVQARGVCQPIKSGESIEYQWGFSFFQLFVMVILLYLWSNILFVLWITTQLTLIQNNIAASSEAWKGLLELTDNIKQQMASVGINWENLTDKELHREMQHLLTGGPVSTSSEESDLENPLPQGRSSL